MKRYLKKGIAINCKEAYTYTLGRKMLRRGSDEARGVLVWGATQGLEGLLSTSTCRAWDAPAPFGSQPSALSGQSDAGTS